MVQVAQYSVWHGLALVLASALIGGAVLFVMRGVGRRSNSLGPVADPAVLRQIELQHAQDAIDRRKRVD